MFPYIAAIVISIISGWFVLHSKAKGNVKEKLFILFVSFPLILLSALRMNIGTDYLNYLDIFYRIKYNDYSRFYGTKSIEPLYRLLNKLLIFFDMNPQWIFVITSTLYVFLIIYVIYELSPYPLFSVFMLYGTTAYFEQYNAMRQHLACAILLLAFLCLLNSEKKKFIIMVVIAGLFHYTALFFLIVYFFDKLNIKKKTIIVIIMMSIIMEPLVVRVVFFVLSNTFYSVYLSNNEMVGSGMLGILIQAILLLLMTIYYKKNRIYRLLYYLMSISFVSTIYLDSIPLMGRLRWMFFYPVIVCGIPVALKNIYSKQTRVLLKTGMIVCFSIYAYITIVIYKGYGVYPYQSIIY